MKFIKKLLFVVIFIPATVVASIIMLILDSLFNIDLSGGDVFFWSVISGLVIAFVGQRLLPVLLMNRANKFMQGKMPQNNRQPGNKQSVIIEDIPYTNV